MTQSDSLTPSLLERQSRGGDIAEAGFLFQAHIILARIPVWLSQEGFTSVRPEGSADVDVKFFIPGHGFATELVEVKNHTLQPSEFWKEIQRFKELDTGSPSTYRRFTLVATGASKELEPLVNGLRRVRDPYNFYEDNTAIKDNSLKAYIQIIKKMGRTEQEALFIFEKVEIEVDFNTAKSHGEALFKQSLIDNLPEYDKLSSRTLDDIYNHLSTFLRQRKNQTLIRKELENKLQEKIPSKQRAPLHPILIYTAITPEDNPNHSGLRFDWSAFSGGESRAIAPTQSWNQQLMTELRESRNWIENHRSTKRIRLAGNRRLSACLAIGSVFSAVRGYAIEMEYREKVWATDAYPTAKTPDYSLIHEIVGNMGDRLIVNINIGITKDIVPEVESNLKEYGLSDMPYLHIKGKKPITSPQQANLIVRSIKELIVKYLLQTAAKELHLFLASPAPVALFLGHRLDATAPVVCYMWTGIGQYSQTCRLFEGVKSKLT